MIMPTEPTEGYSPTTNTLGEISSDFPGMCGITSYNRVEGHFYLKRMPDPKSETVNRTVQGLADRFESGYEDPSVASMVSMNDKVNVTRTVYQGEILSTQTKSAIGTFTATSGSAKTSAIVQQGGLSYYDGSTNVTSSSANTIVAIAVEDIRPFALKDLDTEHDALFDFTDLSKPTNENYIRHLTPEQEPRVAVIDSPADLISSGGPPKILIYYDAVDLSGEVVASWKGSSFASAIASHSWAANDLQGINNAAKRGWLVVKRTVPDANTVYIDNSGASPNYRPLFDWLRLPYTTANANNTWTPLTIHAPGGLISIPTKDLEGQVRSNSLQMNPSGGITNSPFINLENCAHTVAQRSLAGLEKGTNSGIGVPMAQANTRSPVSKSDSAYHTLSVRVNGKQTALTSGTSSQQPVCLEQFDIIDNIVEADRHLLLIHPKNRHRSNTLGTLYTTHNSKSDYHSCSIELMLMRGRVEEIAPNSDAESGGSGVLVRGRSQLMDISDRVAERDFNLTEGYPVKEIGDLGSPSVSLMMGGVGQGAIDIKPDRTEHSFLPVWKDRIVGAGNPSVRNDRQTSTYYASTRALVELPLFPSMFYDTEKRLSSSENKRTPLPDDQSMELILDCSMTAANRPQMQQHESRWAIDWGMKNMVSALKVHDQAKVVGNVWVRCMRESAATYIRRSEYNSAHGESVDLAYYGTHPASSYFEVDSVLPFVREGGLHGIAAPTNGHLQPANNQIWTLDAVGDDPDGNGFVVTVGEGILSERGLRLHIWKMEINGDSHRLYWNRFHDFDNNAAGPTGGGGIERKMITGLPVVMGCWLTDEAGEGQVGVSDLTGITVGASTSNATLAQNFVLPMERALGLRHGSGTTRICIDPDDNEAILINDGPTMEGFSFDPGNYLYGNDDIPLVPPIECRSGYLALKGKRSDNTLDYVRPMRIKLGEVSSKGTVTKFDDAVDELIRQINQAGHPLAKNENGGSAFDPPTLFTAAEGTYTVTSDDTGSHMGYIRAFLGGDVESRDGEQGRSIVIHSTIPGATGRNFAVWLNNYGPYPYRPIQAVGHGGLVATNSRSYQAGSFPAPLPLGMDGETHVPITTFQGGVHGAVEDLDGNLRTYNGIGQEFEFKTVRNPKDTSNSDLPPYDPDTQSILWVERKALDALRRISKATTWGNEGLILVDDKHLGTFTHNAAGIGGTISRASGTGACAGLWNVYPLDRSLGKKWKDLFYDSDGNFKEVPIKVISPLIDAHGILFFGGGHTGVTFDVSDGTANDYSDFYTHHYAKGPTGYSGFQNLQEVQTSAAVLDFTEIRNSDTVKENTYRGIHHAQTVTSTGVAAASAHLMTHDCLFYVRMNHASLGSTNHGLTTGTEIDAEDLYGTKLKAFGNWSSALAAVAASAVTVDGDASGALLQGAHATPSGNAHTAISLHKIEINGTNQVLPRVPIPANMVTTPWSISFFVHPGNTGTWSSAAHGNGPVLQGIDANGKQWGVSIISKQHSTTSHWDYKIIANASAAAGTNLATTTNVSLTGAKDAWYHVVVTSDGSTGIPLIYVNGAVKATTNTSTDTDHVVTGDAGYNAGSNSGQPHLTAGIGVGTLAVSGVVVSGTVAVGGTTITVGGASALTHFSIGDEVFTNAGVFLGIVDSLNATTIGFKEGILAEAPNTNNLKKVSALATGLYGRAANMAAIGISLCSHEAYDLTGSYYYGEPYDLTVTNSNPIYFKGRLSEVALWNKVLSASEITTLYNARSVWN